MSSAVLIIIGIIEAAAGVGLLFYSIQAKRSGVKDSLTKLQTIRDEKAAIAEKIEAAYSEMTDFASLHQKVRENLGVQEALKAERGRITITQAELETVETRLRELEEIERELEASGIETKEELNILKKKEEELAKKNDQLKQQLTTTLQQTEAIIGELESTSQLAEQVNSMKTDLIMSQQQIDILLLQIEQGNEQYFILKQRYDALDIEYAQLYEKFSESEAAAGGGGGGQ